MKTLLKTTVFLLLLFLCGCGNSGTQQTGTTNFIIIYCDDLGYGDLGCFGADDILTPNIDRMADEGMKFTSFYAASPVCSPSRAALLTGRIPQRMGIQGVFFPESFTGMPVEEMTIADMLKPAGYHTGIIGKWHLGHMQQYLPLQRGFDEYFGIPYSNDMESVVYLEGNELAELNPDQHLLTQTYTTKALDFIERNSTQPFFLYLAHSMPHVPIYASENFEGTSRRGLYGDVVQELDWSVGQILDKLKEEGIQDNTLVIFSSDNGPWLAMRDHGGSAGSLREGKQFTFEGGQRVPTIAFWPGKIQPGTKYDDMGLMMDWFPTICEIAGVSLPDGRAYDGESLLGVLEGTGHRMGDEFLYYDGGLLQCYRKGDWKIKLPYDGNQGTPWKKKVDAHPLLLINLSADPGEKFNLADSNPEKVKEMLEAMEAYKKSKGDLPPRLVTRTAEDQSHLRHLRETLGPNYYKED